MMPERFRDNTLPAYNQKIKIRYNAASEIKINKNIHKILLNPRPSLKVVPRRSYSENNTDDDQQGYI